MFSIIRLTYFNIEKFTKLCCTLIKLKSFYYHWMKYKIRKWIMWNDNCSIWNCYYNLAILSLLLYQLSYQYRYIAILSNYSIGIRYSIQLLYQYRLLLFYPTIISVHVCGWLLSPIIISARVYSEMITFLTYNHFYEIMKAFQVSFVWNYNVSKKKKKTRKFHPKIFDEIITAHRFVLFSFLTKKRIKLKR